MKRSGWTLILFFALAYAASWACFVAIPLLGLSLGFERFPSAATILFLLGIVGPAAAATIVCWGRPGSEPGGRSSACGELRRAVLHWRFAWWWYAAAALGVPALHLAFVAVHVALGGAPPDPWLRLPPGGWIVLLGQVWVVLGEEPGWRGFALPRLQALFGSLGASLVLGVLWAGWHLPLFFIPGAPQYGASFPAYVVSITAVTVILSALYARTGGSVLACMIFHASLNATAFVVQAPAGMPRWISALGLAVLVGAIALLPRPWFGPMRLGETDSAASPARVR